MGKLQRHKVRILGQIRKNNRQNGQKLEETNNNREMGCFPTPISTEYGLWRHWKGGAQSSLEVRVSLHQTPQ